MSQKMLLFGLGDFARMVARYFEREAGFEVVSFTAHKRFITESVQDELPLTPFESLPDLFAPENHRIFIALESGRQNVARSEVLAEAIGMGYTPASFVSASAQISQGAKLGEHCLVLENAVIQDGCEIGNNNLIFANAFFGQKSRVADSNYFSSGFFADRHSKIGSNSVFGSHVKVAESVSVADWASIRSFEVIQNSLLLPTIIHPVLRTPGRVVDRRSQSSKP